MSLRVCILASSSKGNSTYVSSETTSILIDAGISARRLTQGLEEIGANPADLSGICVTHEHDDHVRGIPTFAKKYSVPLFANHGTAEAMAQDAKSRQLSWNLITTGNPFQIGDLEIDTFAVPHDAYEPIGLVVRSGPIQLGVAMDLGIPTALIRERLRGSHAVILEANHDERLLQEAERPWHLKQRIRGRQGHLSNDHTADVLADIAGAGLRRVFLAHLSQDCNREELALSAARRGLEKAGQSQVEIRVAHPDRATDVWAYAPDAACP